MKLHDNIFSSGVFEGKFELTYPVKPGTWQIAVDAFVSMIFSEPRHAKTGLMIFAVVISKKA